jgi:hypothetical protein
MPVPQSDITVAMMVGEDESQKMPDEVPEITLYATSGADEYWQVMPPPLKIVLCVISGEDVEQRMPVPVCVIVLFLIAGDEFWHQTPELLVLPPAFLSVKPSTIVEESAPDGLVTMVPEAPPSSIVTLALTSLASREVSTPANPPYSPTPARRVILSKYGWLLAPDTHISSPAADAAMASATLRYACSQSWPGPSLAESHLTRIIPAATCAAGTAERTKQSREPHNRKRLIVSHTPISVVSVVSRFRPHHTGHLPSNPKSETSTPRSGCPKIGLPLQG